MQAKSKIFYPKLGAFRLEALHASVGRFVDVVGKDRLINVTQSSNIITVWYWDDNKSDLRNFEDNLVFNPEEVKGTMNSAFFIVFFMMAIFAAIFIFLL